MSFCAEGLAIAPPLARWTAYVSMNVYGQTQLWAAKSDAQDEAILLHESEYPLTSLRWSPDGRFLAFVDQDGGLWASSLYLVDFKGNEPAEAIAIDDSGGSEMSGTPTWSPDSTQLAYAEPFNSTELRIIDLSSGSPAAPARFGFNCPQGAYASIPCLGSYLQPLRMEWSPTGKTLALLVVSEFFANFSTGSAADLFLLDNDAPEGDGQLASPFVPSFDPARRGVAPETFVWSPEGSSVAYAGSFEDTSSVAETYAFRLGGEPAMPLKLHIDLGSPNEGTRGRVGWASETVVLFASDLTTPSVHELFSTDVSDPGALGFPSPETLLDASGGSVLTFGLSPDRGSIFVLRKGSESQTAKLSVFAYDGAPLTDALEVSSKVASVGGGFGASAKWSLDSELVGFVEQEGGTSTLTIAGFLADGASCATSSLEVDALTDSWHWLEDESSVVLLDATGVHRLNAGSGSAERLSGDLAEDETIVAWAVQPRGEIE
jgi:WD40 repeat protein